MTEAEANLTRCCGPEGCGGNSAGEPERYCVASRCMGWRWEQEANQPALTNWAKGDMSGPAPESKRQSATFGFCGLAGEP